MFSAHQQNYLVDTISFALSVLPVAMLLLFVSLAWVEVYRRSSRRKVEGRGERFEAVHRRDDTQKKAA